MTSWLDRLLAAALTLVAVALLLNWAWRLIHPLIPIMVTVAGIAILITYVIQRQRGW